MCAALLFAACTPIRTEYNETTTETGTAGIIPSLRDTVSQDELHTLETDINTAATNDVDMALLISAGNDFAMAENSSTSEQNTATINSNMSNSSSNENTDSSGNGY